MADAQILRAEPTADASFLIGLCFAEQFPLLEAVFPRVFVVPAVWEEVVVRGAGRPGAEQMASSPVLVRYDVRNSPAVAALALFLGAGESETIVLAQELGCPLVLMDDLRARKAARRAGLKTLGVVGFLLAAKRDNLLPEIKPSLDKLIAHGFRLGQTLIEGALREAGEA